MLTILSGLARIYLVTAIFLTIGNVPKISHAAEIQKAYFMRPHEKMSGYEEYLLGGSRFIGYGIKIVGEIKRGDGVRFKNTIDDILREKSRPLEVILNSRGGLVDEAIYIAELIRILKIDTRAPLEGNKDERCESACFFIWLAGFERRGDRLGMHRPYFEASQFSKLSPKQASDVYGEMSEQVAQKLKAWGLSDELYRKMMSANSNRMIVPSPAEISPLRTNPAYRELVLAKCGNVPDDETYTAPGLEPVEVLFEADGTPRFVTVTSYNSDCYRELWLQRIDEGIQEYKSNYR